MNISATKMIRARSTSGAAAVRDRASFAIAAYSSMAKTADAAGNLQGWLIGL